MTKTSETSLAAALELAALAIAAVEDLQIHAVRPGRGSGTKGISTWAAASHGDEWQIYCPHDPLSKSRLDAVLRAQAALANERSRGTLSFNVPAPRGIVNRRDGRLVFIFPALGGEEATTETFASETLFSTSLAGALASLHAVDPDRIDSSAVPRQTAADHRAELKSLMRTHWTTIPTDLRTRWDNALRDDTLWQYRPCVIHGSLEPADVQVAGGGAVVAIKGFERVQIGDPAKDTAWLLYYADQPFLERFESTYAQQYAHGDLHLMTRARLLAELETLRWHDAATRSNDREWRDEGQAALKAMDQELRGTALVDAPHDVVHIDFQPHEEPLLRLTSSKLPETMLLAEERPDHLGNTPSTAAQGGSAEDEVSPETAATTVHPINLGTSPPSQSQPHAED